MTKKYKFIILVGFIITALIIIVFFAVSNNKVSESLKTSDNIVFLGNSITSSYDLDKYFPKYKTINSGIWGDITDDVYERLDNDVISFNPSQVFILLGINDIGGNRDNEYIEKCIKKIIDKIKIYCPNTEIYLLSVYPVNISDFETWYPPMSEDINEVVDDLNVKLAALSLLNDVEFIDVAKHLKNDDNELEKKYTIEGLHLTDTAYAKISTILKDYLVN